LFETQLTLANTASLGATSSGVAGVYLDGTSKDCFANMNQSSKRDDGLSNNYLSKKQIRRRNKQSKQHQ
jgi:hypothetical protein